MSSELPAYSSDEESETDISDCVSDDNAQYSRWSLIPEPVFLSILQKLSTSDTIRAGQVCRRWNVISKDDYLWRKFFQRDFKVAKNIGLKPGTS